jgi:predicted NAD/FAD-binding protein
MKKVLPPSSVDKTTRRDTLKSAAAFAGLGVTGAIGCGSPAGSSGPDSDLQRLGGKPRVAVIGGGAGGIAATYLMQGPCDVDLFEARSKIGGHADSHTIDYQGQNITVDLGAQFFHPATHPLYVTLLEEVGLYDPDHPDSDETLEAPGSVCIFPIGGGAPTFVSTNALATPFVALDFAFFTQLARQAVLLGMPYEVRLDTWIEALPIRRSFKDTILYPWISSLIGTSRANAVRTSARSILQTFALAFPANLLAGASTFNSKIGLEGNLQRLLQQVPGARVHVDAPISSMAFDGTTWTLVTPTGNAGPFDAVVMNTPPLAGRTLVRALPWAGDVATLLETYEYFDSRIVIHTDAAYVHSDRANWATYNAGVDGIECEGSAWLGGIHEKLPTGGTVDVFKSWAQRRRADPTNILLERRFKHPLITRDAIAAARSLRAFQGRNGLYFSGQYTTGVDAQETALYSAIQVAKALAPSSPQLASLNARLAQRGRSNISYDL